MDKQHNTVEINTETNKHQNDVSALCIVHVNSDSILQE